MMDGLRVRLLGLQRWGLLRLAGRRWAGMKARHLVTGERGEMEAMFYLRRQGYQFVERRWRSAELRGDVDLIGWDGAALCFVEVKTRTARDFAPAASAVDGAKKRMLRRMAKVYRGTLPRAQRKSIPLRFDVVSVYLLGEAVECELVRGAFGLEEEFTEWGHGAVPSRYGV